MKEEKAGLVRERRRLSAMEARCYCYQKGYRCDRERKADGTLGTASHVIMGNRKLDLNSLTTTRHLLEHVAPRMFRHYAIWMLDHWYLNCMLSLNMS